MKLPSPLVMRLKTDALYTGAHDEFDHTHDWLRVCVRVLQCLWDDVVSDDE